MPKGFIHFTVAALHDTQDLFFNFIEKEFKILEVDHSELETYDTVSLLLEDPECRWFVPSTTNEIHTYSIQVQRQVDGTHTFKVTLD